MHTNGFQQLTPIEIACSIIENYILAVTGKRIKINLPIQPKDEGKFITALNVAINYFER